MALGPEALYLQLGQLVAEMPELVDGPITDEANRWLARASALVEEVADLSDRVTLRVSIQSLDGPLREGNAQTIKSIVLRTLARVELDAPVAAQGAFIPAGGVLDAFVAFAKVLEVAQTDVLIVDPYADEKALFDFAVLAAEGVKVRLLADERHYKPALRPAAARWVAQFGAKRPLEVRLAAAGALHDRLLIVDHGDVRSFGQSLNAIATRASTILIRVPPETAALKRGAFEQLWEGAAPL